MAHQNHLLWFGQVRCIPINTLLRKSELTIVEVNPKERGKPNLTCGKIFREDMSVCNLPDDIVLIEKNGGIRFM